MPEQGDTLVFLPAWNEEENLPAVLDELRRELPEADLLVVDDGSTDGTAVIARVRGAAVISFEANRGLPAGIAAGYAYAAEHGYAWCGRVDADGQHPVAELARLLERVRSGECDVAVGSRFASGEGFAPYRYRPSAPRRFGTAVLRRSMAVALRRPFLDATSGMYAANARAVEVLAAPVHDRSARGRGAPAPERGEAARGRGAGRHASARGRRVEAAGQEGAARRRDDHRHAAGVPAPAEGPLMRLVAVLGYSGRPRDALHDVCAARVRHAEQLVRDGDAVLLSGEAELMRGAWDGHEVLLDPEARNTWQNARGVAAAARRLGADEVLVVTSSWHAFRARRLVRAALPGVAVTSASPRGRASLVLLARELACFAALPLHLRRSRRG